MIKDIIGLDNNKSLFNFQKFGIKNLILVLISMLMITDIVILLNIPYLREIMAFIYFTTVPGLLILNVLKLNKIEFLKKVVLSIGISIAFLMFTGLVLNSLYPFILKPLSLMPVLVSFNLILIFLALISYIRNKDDFDINELNFKIGLKNKLTFMLIFPILFPFMAILGTYLMNTTQNNVVLLSMLFLIPIYIILIAFFRNRIHESNYPFAIWTISLSLLLMSGLTSQFIMGRDVHNELYCFRLTLTNFHWDLNTYINPYNACLSITILPTIYSVLSAINEQYIFKLLFALIGSFIPLTIYIVAKKYFDNRYAFFATLLFVFQLFFIGLLGAVRQEIAVMFFFLAIMIIFSTDIDKLAKKVLFLVFICSLLVSHYSTAYASFVLIFPILILPFLRGLIKERRIDLTNFDIILISFGFIAIWYMLYANVQFTASSHAIQQATVATKTTSGVGNTSFLAQSKGDYVLGILGIKLKSIPNAISVVVHDLVFAAIGIGLLAIARKHKFYRKKFGTDYILGIVLSVFLLVLFVLMPYISIAYDVARLFFQLIIFLAPVFIIGTVTISKLIKKPKWDIAIILILLISLFSCTTYLQYHFSGIPYSAVYEQNGIIRGESFIYTSEITGVNWLKKNRINNLTIYSDTRQIFPYNIANFRNNNTNTTFFAWNKTVNSGYIYLGYTNVNKKKVYEIGQDINIYDLNSYSHLFVGKEKIYDSGGSQIWF